MAKEPTYYARLGVPIDASPDEIRYAYREAARRLHPDSGYKVGSTELFLQIQQAYEVLSEPEKRSHYDASLPPDATVPPAITITTQYSRSFLQCMEEPQLVYALLELQAQPDPDFDPSPPINVCLIVDCSTSMQGLYMDMVKSTAIELVRQLRPQDVISLVAFSDRAEVVVPAGQVNDLNHIETSIRMLQTGGGTEMLQGLETGLDQVNRYLGKDYVNHMILLTDGRTYGDESGCIDVARRASDLGIGISSLGIGGKWNDIFLDKLASITGGSTTYGGKPKDVKHFLRQKFSGLIQSYADRTTFHYEVPEGITLKSAFRLQPESGPLDTSSPTQLGSIPRDTPLSILFEFLIDRISPTTTKVMLADGRLVMEIPSRPIPIYTMHIQLERQTSQNPIQPSPPLAIMQAMSRLTLYKMQEQAKTDISAGDYKNATRRLQSLATNLFSKGEQELARTVLGEAANIQKKQEISEEGHKRIKYGTRSLLLPSSEYENNHSKESED